MDREQLLKWKRGFELAAEREQREQARSTPLQRLRQLAALMRMSRQLGLGPVHSEAEMESARQRWVKLRAAYEHGTAR